ncbi:MAG: BCCT family transporter [Candidatus Thiodiazotropha sp.]|nr:BCCT family transporter [Candidatus Thiodiazotropha sp.]MCM8883250.1 BCCT family transporter [Candidatus Thiodiazotropha sp.]MCM8920949.1 BCCT family transporter [Candidatus Thiodiazotropha sp.]MCU7804513.1 BCCT family transporter [Candidatus Thiodiazotropha sp. (ex Lucinoma borealis)]MCU7867787.1 BCCT family transporter [Candidatus Thiodiazotropha sp. (ex Lucinoma borealis)]
MSNDTTDDPYDTDYEIGQDNLELFGMDMHNPVFFISAGLILIFVIGALLFPADTKSLLDGAKGWSIENFDWLFIWSANIFVLFCIALVFLPVGKIRIGGIDAVPEFSTLSWFAMLFAAGMGIGLMFWSVAEPVAYYTDWYGTPLNVAPNTPEAARAALGATMYHWGLHPWAIYAVVALSLSFFAYNKGMPLTIRSAFYPLLGEACWGWAGHAIDLLAVLATIFGLATSLGLGAQQAAGGLQHLFDIPNAINTQIAIIVGVTSVAIFSVVRGIDGGVKLLSNINIALAALLLVFILLFGQGLGFFTSLANTASAYVENFLPLSNSFGREDDVWFHGWTVFYWAWWISWSPFVGMFIARISKGRTVREFIIAVLLVPTFVTLIWMSAFGGTGLDQAVNDVGQLANGISDVSLAMFHMLENLPLASLTSFLGISLVLIFFVTSSDSGSLVIDSITSGGKVDAPVPQRIFWATLEGVIAGTLLYGGGAEALQALQAGAISVGLPFTVVLLLMCVSLYKGLSEELRRSA